MEQSFEEILVHHTSPTLKGYKAGSLFSYRPSCETMFQKTFKTLQQALSRKNIRICVIEKSNGSKQIVVYRPQMIEDMLSQPDFQCFLCQLGYPVDKGHEANVAHLLLRIKKARIFPTRLVCFWVIRLRMFWGLSSTRVKIILCAAFGRYTRNRKRQRSVSTYFKDVGNTVWNVSGRGRVFCSLSAA